MELKEAKSKAEQVLIEEQINPTVGYNYQFHVSGHDKDQSKKQSQADELGKTLTSIAKTQILATERALLHRPVHEDPSEYQFVSRNYDLLVRIFQMLGEKDRSGFVAFLLSKVSDLDTAWWARGGRNFPFWNDRYSYLPLVAEFCVRTGNTDPFIESLLTPMEPSDGLIMMTMQLSEMVCLNFTVFSDAELERLSEAIGELSNVGNKYNWSSKKERGKIVKNPDYKPEYKRTSDELVDAIVALDEQCRKARYLYLKGALEETTNWEIENDKTKITGYLDSLGFDHAMKLSLEAAEQHFGVSASGFELKSCMGHLRSFLEQLHIQACAPIAASAGQPAPTKWGPATLLLRTSGIISVTEEKFVTSLYTLISDEAVHPLMAEREYARIRRNMIIEYGLMLLSVLDKRGVNIQLSAT
jgi:hypothetical protein